MNIAATSAQTRAALGWVPNHVGLIADLEQSPRYFVA
jgi:hypothetical protein